MKTKKLICCLATLALAFGFASLTTFVKTNAENSTPTFGGIGVSLSDDIVLRFKVENYSDDYSLTFGYKGITYEGTVENGMASFNLVTPQYLDESVTATIYKGEDKVTEAKKSVKEYLYELVNADKSDFSGISCEKFLDMKTLAVDMLNYGTAAQNKYLEKDSFTAVNAGLSAEQKEYATEFVTPSEKAKATLTGDESDLFSWVGAGIRFDYNVSLYFLVKPTAENAVLKLKVGDNEVIDKYSVEDGVYKFRYESVSVVDFGKSCTVNVLDESDNAIGQTLTYSVNSYVLNMYSTESMGEIVKATYNYGVSALAYLNAGDNHVYKKLEFAEEQRVIAGEDALKENLAVNKVCSACGNSVAVTEASYDTAKTFTVADNTVEVTADGITYNTPVTVLTRIVTPDENIINFGSSWAGWQIEFDRTSTLPEGYAEKKGLLGQSFVERIEYTVCNDSGDLGKIYLVKNGNNGYLSTTDGKYNVKLSDTFGNLYAVTNDSTNITIEWSRLAFFALGKAYSASTEYYVKAKVIAKNDSLYVDSKEIDFDKAKKFTTMSDDSVNLSEKYLITGEYAAPDSKMLKYFGGWGDGAASLEFNRYDSRVKDSRLSNANVLYIEYIIYDTYSNKDLGSVKLVAAVSSPKTIRGGMLKSMDDKQSLTLEYSTSKDAYTDLYIGVTKTTKEGGGLSDNGQKLKDLIDYAIKDNIPSDGYYSLAFKGRVVVAQCSEFTNSEVYDYGKMGVFSDLISNYKPEA